MQLGADGIFVAGLKTPEDFARVGARFRGAWNSAAVFENAATPWLTPRELHAMGFSQVAYPNILIGRVTKAIECGLDRLHRFAHGQDDAFAEGESELALAALAEAVDAKEWNLLEARVV